MKKSRKISLGKNFLAKENLSALKDFLQTEAAGGFILVAVCAFAMFAANTPLLPYYEGTITPTVKFFINDVLMCVFFLLIGLEIRTETINGSLSTRAQAALPIAAALGGVITPAIIYFLFNNSANNINSDISANLQGWAIPTATDIAFSLGILALFGSRLPHSLKIFLMAVAIIDDLVAIIIIAAFYTSNIAFAPLFAALIVTLGIWFCSHKSYQSAFLYIMLGIALWFFIHAAGIHPTIAGAITGLLIPRPISAKLIHHLHHIVAYGIVPLFVFANAGINFSTIPTEAWLHNITIGIAAGLFIGKPLGIFIVSYPLIRYKIFALPQGAKLVEFFAVCVTCGIGFTMSLFIGDLAFHTPAQMLYTKLGVMLGSLFSALFGGFLLYILNYRHK